MTKQNPFDAAIETLSCDLADMKACVGPPTCHNHSLRIKEYEAAIRLLEAAGKVDKELAIKTLRRLYHPMFQEKGRPVSVPIFDTIMPLLEAIPGAQATKIDRWIQEDRNPALPDEEPR